jgi:hypothetical protein
MSTGTPQLERGDVVRSVDPFKLGTDRQRPWLVLSTDHHPFFSEQSISVAVSTKSHSDSIALADAEWEVGGVPRESFASPWALHSPRIEDLETWQGRVSESLVDRVVEQVNEYF